MKVAAMWIRCEDSYGYGLGFSVWPFPRRLVFQFALLWRIWQIEVSW